MATPPLLSVRDLVVEFPTRRGVLRALDGVSFDIARGEVLGMVGESGAGKSLTGAAIIGLLEPPGRVAGGRIELDGVRIDQLQPAAMRRIRGRRIGMVFQDPLTSLNPLYTVAEQLIETIRAHLSVSGREARQRAIELLEQVGIPAAARRIDDYPHAFSGGMRQRVVIALALAADPELVIADEPTTALDVSVQAQIIDVLRAMCAERGAGVLLITHDMGVIAETADRVAVLYAGRLAEVGPTQAVIRAPEHPYTVGLMGAVPSPFSQRDRLVQIPGAMPSLAAMPAGCAFHPRCGQVLARCRVERPALLARGAARQTACWLYPQVDRRG
jgi:peptide/nickel transport system ATP-binding protein